MRSAGFMRPNVLGLAGSGFTLLELMIAIVLTGVVPWTRRTG
jgi:prepilin-type N-terminal cleavage/methylation domain-containing protein